MTDPDLLAEQIAATINASTPDGVGETLCWVIAGLAARVIQLEDANRIYRREHINIATINSKGR